MEKLKIDFKNHATTTLEFTQRFIEYLSTEMVQFCENVEKAKDQKKIGPTYYMETMDLMKKHINHNNEILMMIDKELQARVKKTIPQLVSFHDLEKIGKSLTEEIERYATMSLSKTEKPVLSFKTSSEKRYDSK